jgi:hypothetical protein
MSCEIKDRLKRGYEEANQGFGDCLIALTRIQAGRQYDLLTMQKDLFFSQMQTATRMLEQHIREHGC